MNIDEASGIVDEIIILEHNFTHTGREKPFYFSSMQKKIESYSDKSLVKFVRVDLTKRIIKEPKNSEDLHFNERLMRSSFVNETNLKKSDIVFSVDADEIIYRRWIRILKFFLQLVPYKKIAFRIPMHQFYYRMNYLWKGFTFSSAVAGHVRFLEQSHIQWRDFGIKLPIKIGCHFSWQLTPVQMLEKISNYSHNFDYRHLADLNILEHAIANKTYPFEPDRDFNISELGIADIHRFYPKSFTKYQEYFSHLLPEDWE